MSEIIVILVLVLANAVFAGAEIALVTLRKTRIVELADEDHGGARAVLALRGNPERFLATVQVGITVVGSAAAAFGGRSIAARLEPWIAHVGWFKDHAEGIALALVIAAVSYLTVVIGELVPKSLALRSAERYALLIARPLLWLSWVARPLVWLLSASANLVLKPFGDTTTFTETRHSAEELQELVAEASQAGTIPPGAGEIVSRALELPDLTAADAMVPRENVVMLARGASRDELRRVLLEHKYNRIPVYEGTTDNVVGYIVVKDVIALAWERDLFVMQDLIRPPFFVPETKRVVALINEMRSEHSPFAIVVDEHGGTSGIVTIEDLVEELVGEIVSEHARQAREGIKLEDEGSALVAGPTPLREVNRALDIELPEDGDFSTIAGLCLTLAGRVPANGERFTTTGGVELEIVDASERRIRAVRVRIPKPSQPSE